MICVEHSPVCVCVCVCVGERDGERGREREREVNDRGERECTGCHVGGY